MSVDRRETDRRTGMEEIPVKGGPESKRVSEWCIPVGSECVVGGRDKGAGCLRDKATKSHWRHVVGQGGRTAGKL